MTNCIHVLGGADPEMEAIEALLVSRGERVAHATYGGERVRPDNAYKGTGVKYVTDCGHAGDPTEAWVLIECDVPTPDGCPRVLIDHHRLGDPGYGRPPAEFLAASSLGQVISHLARRGNLPETWRTSGLADDKLPRGRIHSYYDARGAVSWAVVTVAYGETGDASYGGEGGTIAFIPQEIVLAAAADHCLGAAYRGECPGVDPDALLRWRVASRARFQDRSAAEVRADIERAREALRDAKEKFLTDANGDTMGFVRDMRSPTPVPELVEAATRDNVSYVAGPFIGPDGRHKYTVSGGPNTVRAWMEQWAPSQGLTDIYGDPARGFAGGYANVE